MWQKVEGCKDSTGVDKVIMQGLLDDVMCRPRPE